MFRIVCDTLSDFPKEWCEAHDVHLVAMHLRGKYKDELDVLGVHPADVYVDLAAKGILRLSQPSAAEFMEVFNQLIDQSDDPIICITASSALLQVFDNAVAAAREVKKRCQVAVIDSKLVSAGEAMVVADLVHARQVGMSFEEAIEHVQQLIPRVTVLFITPPGAALYNHTRSNPLKRLRTIVDGWTGSYGFVAMDGRGHLTRVGHHGDQRLLAGRIARLMSLDAQREGPLRYIEVSVGFPRNLSILEKPLDTNEFISTRSTVINASGSVAVALGLGAMGIAYAPVRYLVHESSETDPLKDLESLEREGLVAHADDNL